MRFDPYAAGDRYYGDLLALSGHLHAGPLDPKLTQLVEIRVSQLAGCGFCLALHSGLARKAGVTQKQLDTLAGWRESHHFSDSERAALGLAEQMSRIGNGSRVDDETWRAARQAFTDAELSALLYVVGLITVWNRLNVAVELPSDYALPS